MQPNVDQMLDPLTNLFGKLQPDIRTRLTAVILTPNQQTWENAYSIILNGESFTTLWKAVIAVDPSFPRSKRMEGEWPAVPSRDTISKAILYAMPMMKTVI